MGHSAKLGCPKQSSHSGLQNSAGIRVIWMACWSTDGWTPSPEFLTQKVCSGTPRICISSKFPDDSIAAGPEISFWEPLLCIKRREDKRWVYTLVQMLNTWVINKKKRNRRSLVALDLAIVWWGRYYYLVLQKLNQVYLLVGGRIGIQTHISRFHFLCHFVVWTSASDSVI